MASYVALVALVAIGSSLVMTISKPLAHSASTTADQHGRPPIAGSQSNSDEETSSTVQNTGVTSGPFKHAAPPVKSVSTSACGTSVSALTSEIGAATQPAKAIDNNLFNIH
ncbi:MAG TPA: hypothetical protein VH143_02970 [Kofleriaceae bacterium]|nr:hypothetical protein [Kofleriaceae bacterium]